MYKKLYFFLFLLLIACEPALDADSEPQSVVKVFKSNFHNNKNKFYNVIRIHKSNPNLTLEELRCWTFEDQTDLVKELCQKQLDIKLMYWQRDIKLGSYAFRSFSTNNGIYWNGYAYVYYKKITEEVSPICKEVMKNIGEEGSCYYKLDNNWFVYHFYGKVNN